MEISSVKREQPDVITLVDDHDDADDIKSEPASTTGTLKAIAFIAFIVIDCSWLPHLGY